VHHEKCIFSYEQLPDIEYMIISRGSEVEDVKIEAIKRISIPTDTSRLRAFIGLANYYRQLVCGFSLMVKPFIFLTKID